jgi:hypothetical protein
MMPHSTLQHPPPPPHPWGDFYGTGNTWPSSGGSAAHAQEPLRTLPGKRHVQQQHQQHQQHYGGGPAQSRPPSFMSQQPRAPKPRAQNGPRTQFLKQRNAAISVSDPPTHTHTHTHTHMSVCPPATISSVIIITISIFLLCSLCLRCPFLLLVLRVFLDMSVCLCCARASIRLALTEISNTVSRCHTHTRMHARACALCCNCRKAPRVTLHSGPPHRRPPPPPVLRLLAEGTPHARPSEYGWISPRHRLCFRLLSRFRALLAVVQAASD